MTQPIADVLAPPAAAGSPAAGVAVAAVDAFPGRLAAFVQTTKPGITRLVTITAGVGFAMSALARPWTGGELAIALVGCLAGTAMSAAGANSLNQWMERSRDSLMRRTASRPLPAGHLTPAAVLAGAAMLCVVGVLLLWATSGALPALISIATIASYLLLYTPLKPLTPLSTIVGSVPGALPPLIGWTAASSETGLAALASPGAWSLFIIMFVWQVPHFLAIAWLYRDDYAAGGHRVLPVVDPTGTHTSRAILAWTVLLIPATLAPIVLMPSPPGAVYALVALATGVLFLAVALRLVATRTRPHARATFIASVIHLPLVMLAMVADASLSAWL